MDPDSPKYKGDWQETTFVGASKDTMLIEGVKLMDPNMGDMQFRSANILFPRISFLIIANTVRIWSINNKKNHFAVFETKINNTDSYPQQTQLGVEARNVIEGCAVKDSVVMHYKYYGKVVH